MPSHLQAADCYLHILLLIFSSCCAAQAVGTNLAYTSARFRWPNNGPSLHLSSLYILCGISPLVLICACWSADVGIGSMGATNKIYAVRLLLPL